MTAVSGYTFFWGLLGLALLIAGTADDEWMAGGEAVGDFGHAPYLMEGQGYGSPRRSFGTTDYRETATDGWGYQTPNVCPKNGQYKEIRRVSEGMIAMLLLSNTLSFFATLTSILAATNSAIVSTLKSSKSLSLAAAISNLVTWALWLRAHRDNLDKNGNNDCRYRGQTSPDHDNVTANRSMGGSFGLCVIACGCYFLLFFVCLTLIKKNGENSPATARWLTITLAIVGFMCIFVASNLNQWTTSSSSGVDKQIQKILNNDPLFMQLTGNDNAVGKTRVDSYTFYGVYTAQYFRVQTWPYSDNENQLYICQENGYLSSTGSATALIHSGRVVLGFCVTGIFLSFIAVLVLYFKPTLAFYLFTFALCCCVVALLVWDIVSYYIIQLHCCSAPTCSLGPSFGLVAAAGFCFFAAIYQQAWIMYNDIYVFNAQSNLKF